MKKWISVLFFMIATTVYADDSASVDQGAKQYDWNTCVSSKASDCLNSCATSEALDCDKTCNDTAKDKCLSEGLNPPQ